VPTACEPRISVLCRRRRALGHRHASGHQAALPQGPSLRPGFCCPGPSPLTRPHPSHSQAQRDFTTWWLIRAALAVPLGLGDPRVVPCFHCSFLLDMPSSPTPGSSSQPFAQLRPRRHWPSPLQDKLGAPKCSHHPLPVGPSISGLRWFAFATACRVASLLGGSDRVSPAAETCTSGLSTRRSPFASPDMTTVAFGHFHRRDSHPLERQLASLHPEGEGFSRARTKPPGIEGLSDLTVGLRATRSFISPVTCDVSARVACA